MEESEVFRILQTLDMVARVLPPDGNVRFREDLINFAYRWIKHERLCEIAPLLMRRVVDRDET